MIRSRYPVPLDLAEEAFHVGLVLFHSDLFNSFFVMIVVFCSEISKVFIIKRILLRYLLFGLFSLLHSKARADDTAHHACWVGKRFGGLDLSEGRGTWLVHTLCLLNLKT